MYIEFTFGFIQKEKKNVLFHSAFVHYGRILLFDAIVPNSPSLSSIPLTPYFQLHVVVSVFTFSFASLDFISGLDFQKYNGCKASALRIQWLVFDFEVPKVLFFVIHQIRFEFPAWPFFHNHKIAFGWSFFYFVHATCYSVSLWLLVFLLF